MKKKYCILFLLILSLSSVHGITFERPMQYAQCDISCSGSRGIERNITLYSLEYGLKAKNAEGRIGFQFSEDNFASTISGDLWPSVSTWKFYSYTINLGGGLTYHFQNNFDVSCEHDIVASVNYRFLTSKNLIFTMRQGFGVKASKVYEISSDVSYLWDQNILISIRLDKILSNGLEFYSEASTYTFYRYALFGSPKYMVGGAYNMDCGLRFGGEFEIGFSDHFTTAPYVNSIIFRMSARYSF